MKKKTVFLLSVFYISLIIFSVFAGAIGGFITVFFWGDRNVKNTAREILNQDVVVIHEDSQIIKIVESSKDSVVSVVISKDLPVYENYLDEFWFFPRRRQVGTELRQVGAGTGFFVSSDGMIITNRHVVEDENASYTVILNDGTKRDAKVLARDTVLDIAFLKIDGNNYKPLPLGSSEELKVGQTVIAIGNALGEFSNSVSMGIISGLGRNIVASDSTGQRAERLNDVIQTDASINVGNSGGPLLDIAGNVIGVNVAVASNAENIGFAIPVDLVKDLMSRFNAEGVIERPVLGVRYQINNQSIAQKNKIPVDYGAIVVKGQRAGELAVIPGSPADKAGILENDIILEINGEKVTEESPLLSLIQKYKIDDEINIKIWRKGDEINLKVRFFKF